MRYVPLGHVPRLAEAPCGGQPTTGPAQAGCEPGSAQTGLTMTIQPPQCELYWVGQGRDWLSQSRAEEIRQRPTASATLPLNLLEA